MKVYYDRWHETLRTEKEAREIALKTVSENETYLEALEEMGYQEIWNMLSEEQQNKILNSEVERYLNEDDNFISRDF